ncbi:MAG: S-layer homology domain-containing protein [Clostridia bacterium]|nr:S-layer homology domain-containing protein [Clostridia bacterium]
MTILKKILCSILILGLLLQGGAIGPAFAATDPTPQEPMQMLRNEPPAASPNDAPIGYNEFDGYYVHLKWNPVSYPGDSIANYINLYLQEINKPYKPSTPATLKERNLSGDTTEFKMKDLKSGTIYYMAGTAYHMHRDGDTTYSSAEAPPSNRLKVMTNIKINAYSYGTNQIKIEWDDVWNSGRRMDYKLFISENKTFSNTPPIYIGQAQIEPNGPVKVNEAAGKLEYVHNVNDPGRVYYIKIAPDIVEPELKRTPESETITVSSFILAKTTKMSTIESGTIWKLDWSPVVTGLGDTDIRVSYQIYKGSLETSDIPQYMAAVDDTNFFITVPTGDQSSYFIIRALVTKNGEEVYPGIKIESDKIIVKEQDLAYTPPVPELVDKFERAPGDAIISYNDQLKPNKATILWRAPKKSDGNIDLDTAYDIWLINDPNLIDQPPDNMKIASSLKMGDSNKVMDGMQLVGYKYEVPNLTANSTYYFKIVAKRTFLEYVNNKLINVTYTSQPAIRVIITPTEGPIDQPKVPARPPFKIKKGADGRELVTENSVTIQLKNKWYEKFNEDTGKWDYVKTERASISDVPDYDPVANPPDNLTYRMVQYDDGVTFDVGCIAYVDGMTYNDIRLLPANKVTNFPVTPNDLTEDRFLNPDNLRHNVDISLTNLNANTSYIIWVRAVRKSVNLISGPSDPIVITTGPVIPPVLEKPTVPSINYSMPGDVYVDLAWNYKTGYNYKIKYGTVENINSAEGQVDVKAQELLYSSFYKVKNLKAQTLYYFWIQAESVSQSGQTSQSAWSDSYSVKTLDNIPPVTPRGFGVSSSPGAITKNSITFEWLKESGMQYRIEIAGDINYKDAKSYNAGAVSEFKVEGLRSNYRYYARLYALDTAKNVESEPTQSVTVRTERSNDDYDADQDVEKVIEGDFIFKDPSVKNDIWNVKIIDVNADRFVEHVQNDHKLDYIVDISKPPAKASKINVMVSNRVFNALSVLKENLIISTGDQKYVVRPGTVEIDKSKVPVKTDDFNLELSISTDAKAAQTKAKNMKFKTGISSVKMNALDGINPYPVDELKRPLKVVVTYEDNNWYKEGITSGVVYDPALSKWNKTPTSGSYDVNKGKGNVSFETKKLGDMAVAESGSDFFDDIVGHWAENAINNVASIHELKSIKGRKFDPNNYASTGYAVKIMMDVLDYNYEEDYMITAAKSGIINFSNAEDPQSLCKRENAVAMVVRVYEIKSGNEAIPAINKPANYIDMGQVSRELYPRVKFAVENGLVNGKTSSTLAPKEPVTRGEVMALLEKMLAYIGEIE